MKIGGLQKLTLIDYPGKPACTVFIAGCNLACPWCHSPELVVPQKIKKTPEIKKEFLFDFLKKRKNVLEGVVICGGEPTIHSELADFIKEINKIGYEVKLDTNGTKPEALKKLIEENLLDYIAMDVKYPLENYKKAAGVIVKAGVLKKSISLIKGMKNHEFRTTVVPGIHEKKDILDIAEAIKGAKRYYLQRFRGDITVDESFTGKDSPDPQFLEEVRSEIKDFFEICEIR